MNILRIFFSLFLAASLLIPYPLLTAEFNPNYLLSDEEMQFKDAMDKTDIHAFLKEKGGYIANMVTEDWEGIKRHVGDIIYNAAQEYSINPKYILVKLQKEQSLITDTDPTQKQLDWATGYGVCDSCAMDDPKIQKYKGFGKQVDNAAGIMRWYYENATDKTWIKAPNKTYEIDGKQVVPANSATAFLYTYTPHIQGNENFWKLWQNWFDQVYPDGTLVKSADASEIYLIQNGQKRPFKDETSLITRFNPKLVVTVPTSELSRYPVGTDISLPNYSVVKQGSYYYLLDYDFKRKFEHADTVRKLGYHPDEIIEVTATDLAGYDNGPVISASRANNPIGRIVRVKENNSLYLLKDDKAFAIYDDTIAHVNFPTLDIEIVPTSELAIGYTRGDAIKLKNGTLFGITGENKIYVVEKGKKRHIASGDVFNALGYKWGNVVWINEHAGRLLETGEPLYVRPASVTPDEASTLADTTNVIEEGTPEKENPLETYMIRTSIADTTFFGPIFDTKIESYVIADYKTGEILAGKNVDVVRPIASLTKVMSGYQLLLDGLTPYDTITYNPKLHQAPYHSFRIAEGERYKVKDLLNTMLVSSLNTPVRMMVNRNGNDEDAFITRMNATAQNMGLQKTTFGDVAGLHEKSASTAREYTQLFHTVSKNQTMRAYLGTHYYEYDEVIDKDGRPHHYDYHSNRLTRRDELSYNIIASKTGFTYMAGPSLVMLVERKSDKKKFIITSLGQFELGNVRVRDDGFNAIADWAMTTF